MRQLAQARLRLCRKVFQGRRVSALLAQLKSAFAEVRASRSQSAETYVVAKGLRSRYP
jgi:23S rRNA U2552 (ribose-2'-O)-methylase RlmE/FtsJ